MLRLCVDELTKGGARWTFESIVVVSHETSLARKSAVLQPVKSDAGSWITSIIYIPISTSSPCPSKSAPVCRDEALVGLFIAQENFGHTDLLHQPHGGCLAVNGVPHEEIVKISNSQKTWGHLDHFERGVVPELKSVNLDIAMMWAPFRQQTHAGITDERARRTKVLCRKQQLTRFISWKALTRSCSPPVRWSMYRRGEWNNIAARWL